MAHWAKVNDEGIVTEVLVTSNEMPNEGLDWLQERFPGKWVQTSYNTHGGVHLLGGEPLRMNYAGIGYTYDEERDAFIAEQPFDSWTLNEETLLWEPPVPRPNDNCYWDDDANDWVAY